MLRAVFAESREIAGRRLFENFVEPSPTMHFVNLRVVQPARSLSIRMRIVDPSLKCQAD
jgi:hypothetical protein